MSVIENEKKYLEIILKHEANGVEFLTSHGVVIEETVKIGKGTQILPGTILKGNTVIGENCVIGPNSMLTDCTVGDGVVFNASQPVVIGVEHRISLLFQDVLDLPERLKTPHVL